MSASSCVGKHIIPDKGVRLAQLSVSVFGEDRCDIEPMYIFKGPASSSSRRTCALGISKRVDVGAKGQHYRCQSQLLHGHHRATSLFGIHLAGAR
jgi:hypothetical protein